MAFGFSPKHEKEYEISGLERNDALVLSLEACKKLKWDVDDISKSGFIAYKRMSLVSWGEQIQIKIEENKICLKSECVGSQFYDWGNNKENIEDFIAKFDQLREQLSDHDLSELHSQLEISEEEIDLFDQQPLSQKEKIVGFLHLFIPREGYFITPILVNINVLVFVVMATFGVSTISPDGESLLTWGANIRTLTIDGQWYRLLSSCFIHIGIFHLLMNMYALVFIGLLLEPYLGKLRFLALYLLTGVIASAVSIYWHQLTISAGASGAIFGMYGVFLALLTSKVINKAARKSLLMSIGAFVAYNLLNGVKEGIDNAAHIGGLASGILLGYWTLMTLINEEAKKAVYVLMILPGLIIGVAVPILLDDLPTKSLYYEMEAYETKMKSFANMEQLALYVYNMEPGTTDEEYLKEIENSGLYYWRENLALLHQINELNLPEEYYKENEILIEYCKLRIRSYQTMYKSIAENTDRYDLRITKYGEELDSIINVITEMRDEQ